MPVLHRGVEQPGSSSKSDMVLDFKEIYIKMILIIRKKGDLWQINL